MGHLFRYILYLVSLYFIWLDFKSIALMAVITYVYLCIELANFLLDLMLEYVEK